MQVEAGADAGVEVGVGVDADLSARVPGARWAMIAGLVTLNFFDVVTTKLILRAGGSEVNPLMQGVIHDPVAAFAIKISMALGVGVLLLRAPVTSKLADRAVLAAIGAYTLVIGWNTGLLIAALRAGRFA